MIQSVLDFAFQRPMLPFKFRQMVLQRHIGLSCSIFRRRKSDTDSVASRRQNMLQRAIERQMILLSAVAKRSDKPLLGHAAFAMPP
jgi:hypothetical protein